MDFAEILNEDKELFEKITIIPSHYHSLTKHGKHMTALPKKQVKRARKKKLILSLETPFVQDSILATVAEGPIDFGSEWYALYRIDVFMY